MPLVDDIAPPLVPRTADRSILPVMEGVSAPLPVTPVAVSPSSLLDRILAVPLVGKLIGANTLILIAAAVVLLRAGAGTEDWLFVVAALAATFAVNVLLVWVALRPLIGLEETAQRIEEGDLAARVERSRLADRDIRRIGQALNLLVDRLTGDRARMRALASQVVRAQDEERARVARELHDSTAQTLAAAMLQIRALAANGVDPVLESKLTVVRDTVAEALEEVRSMAHTMYPRVLDDLGLGPALEWLAGRAEDATGVSVRVEHDVAGDPVPATAAAVLYRVAQEGLRNALTHSGATEIVLRVEADDVRASIEVADNGCGFDPLLADQRRPGMGLFAMRERAALVDGTVEIYSVPGRGTRVTATVPLGPPDLTDHRLGAGIP